MGLQRPTLDVLFQQSDSSSKHLINLVHQYQSGEMQSATTIKIASYENIRATLNLAKQQQQQQQQFSGIPIYRWYYLKK